MTFNANQYTSTGACEINASGGVIAVNIFGEGEIRFERFSTIKDNVDVAVSFVKEGEAFLKIYGVTADGEEKLYRCDKLEGETYNFSFDPINLSVYRDMQSFFVTIASNTPTRVEIKSLTITDERELSVSSEEVVQTDEKHDAPTKMLFIGNSLVFGMELEYGMCASARDKDYFHYVSEYVKTKSPDCKFEKLHGSMFEHSETPEAFEELYFKTPNQYTGKPMCESFTPDIDFISIQLGDNINTDEKNATFAVTGDILMERIRKACPKARIIWVHGWYNREPTYSNIVNLCKRWGVERVEIGKARSRDAEAHEQMTYINKAGVPAPVKDTWRTHPGDKGMKAIADILIRAMNLK